MKTMQRSSQCLCQTSFALPRARGALRSAGRCSLIARCAPESMGVERQGQNFEAAKDIDAIMKALPHRYAFFSTGNLAVGSQQLILFLKSSRYSYRQNTYSRAWLLVMFYILWRFPCAQGCPLHPVCNLCWAILCVCNYVNLSLLLVTP
jgi:hypothetical protein